MTHRRLMFTIVQWMEKETSTGGLYSPLTTFLLREWWSSKSGWVHCLLKWLHMISPHTGCYWQAHFYSLDKTEVHLPPRLTVQVWDNDLFSPDDFIGEWHISVLMSVRTHTHISALITHLIPLILTGTIDIDLLSIPDAKKTASECSLEQLDPKHKKINLFEKKRLKGWWPVFEQVDPENKELTVCRHRLFLLLMTTGLVTLVSAG